MTTVPSTTCFRHPDRETGRRCTRCGRPACPDCLFEASVGAQCVECVREGQASGGSRWRGGWRGDRLLATKVIIAINIAAYLYIAVRDHRVDGAGPTSLSWALFGPAVHNGEWWRLGTSSLVHYGLVHLGFNMLVLWQVGLVLEPAAGKVRFGVIYIVSVLAGSAGAVLLTPHVHVGGASGGVVGVAAAAALVMHRQGVKFWDTGFGPLVVFVVFLEPLFPIFGSVSQGGHLGGLVGGLLTTEAMLQARKANTPALGYVGAAFVGVASVLLAFAVAGR